MSHARVTSRFALVAAVVATAGLSATTAEAAPPLVVLLDGLVSPKGVTTEGRNPLVAQGGFFGGGPVLQYLRSGRGNGSAVAVSDDIALVDVAVPGDGSGWGLGPDQVLYLQDPSGAVTPILDIAAYQAGDPDPTDLDGDGDGSNPYGLAVLPNGDALVIDAQNNDMIRVSRDPSVRPVTVARFVPEVVSTGHVPPGLELPPELIPLPPEMPSEIVPTGVAIGRDGWAYVSNLGGFPFEPGSSHIWRVDPWATDATCDATAPNASCATVVDGLTALIDVAINTNNRSFYTYGLAADGVFAFEEGLVTGEFPSAVLTEVRANGKRRELVPGQLSEPGGVAVASDGTVFATDGVFSSGRLLQIRG
jgi:hypothetical protein